MRHVGGRAEAVALGPRLKRFAVLQQLRRPSREIHQVDDSGDEPADRLRVRGQREPIVERAPLVGLEVTAVDPTQLAGLDEPQHGFLEVRKHAAQAGVHQQRLVVADEKVVELHADLRVHDRQAEDVGSDLINARHVAEL